jgi:hypothetical protein
MKDLSKNYKYNLLKLLNIELFFYRANLQKLAATRKYYYDFGYRNSEEFNKYQDPFYSVKKSKNLSSNYSSSLISFKEISQSNEYLMTKFSPYNSILFQSKDNLINNVIQTWENLSKIYFLKKCFKRGLIKYKNRGGYNVSFWESSSVNFLPKSHSKIHYNLSNNIKKSPSSKIKIKKFLLYKTTYNFEVLSIFKKKRRRWVHFRQNLANKQFFNYNLNKVVSLKKVPYVNMEHKLFLENNHLNNRRCLKKKQLQKFNSDMFVSKIITRNSFFD